MDKTRLNLGFRTRLALVMFLTTASTSAILMATYLHQERRIQAYVTGLTSDLVAISNVTQAHLPDTDDRKQTLESYEKAFHDAGFTSVTLADPNGDILASTDPHRLGKKINIKHRRIIARQSPVSISAQFPSVDVDAAVGQTTFSVEFPIVQNNKVIGYAHLGGISDEVGELLRHLQMVRSFWVLTTLLAGMFVIVYLAFRFTKPIGTLVEGARQVAEGNLLITLPIHRSDEIGRLAQTFNQMVERLREHRRLQERLAEAEKSSLVARFAATVAHEVRNSLNFMNLSIDQIGARNSRGSDAASRELQRSLTNMKDEISRLNSLVSDFLVIGRQAPPHLAACDIKATVEQAVALVEKQALRQGVAIHTDFPASLPNLFADASQLKTCFLNILTNSVQAMPRGGHIEVEASVDKHEGAADCLRVVFADAGPGIPAEDRERIFTPYYSTKTTGFGLGLAITRKIIEDHGGRIFVAQNENPGAFIVVDLPLPAQLDTQPAVSVATTVS